MTTTPSKPLKFSGMIAPNDVLHQPTTPSTPGGPPDEHYLAPNTVNVTIVYPPDKAGPTGIPQYGTPVNGGIANGFAPSTDAGGNYMSCNYQANNNCYAYGCNYATNTFSQPGRNSGYLLTLGDFTMPFDQIGELVSSYAVKDGLAMVGQTWDELLTYQESVLVPSMGEVPGHFVALMISPAGDANWQGDYHWARCDNSSGPCDSWSQKDGGDQVTNFDFAGNPITDPAKANWTVNQGPIQGNPPGTPQPPNVGKDQVVEYGFYCYMFVPFTGVNII